MAGFSLDKPISEKKSVSMGGNDALFIVHEAIRSTQGKGARVQCQTWHFGDRVKGPQLWEVKVLQGRAPSCPVQQGRSATGLLCSWSIKFQQVTAGPIRGSLESRTSLLLLQARPSQAEPTLLFDPALCCISEGASKHEGTA